jgi:hypothetical protein
VISAIHAWLGEQLPGNVDEKAQAWYAKSCAEVAAGVSDTRFASLISMASRYARRRPAQITSAASAQASRLLTGWNPERWSLLDLLRVGLVLARPDLETPTAVKAIVGACKFGDVGELCALYRSFCFLPQPADYLWQAGEGCRSNMNEVFESMACDNPYPAANFDDTAWRALVVKAVFIGAPLWRVHGLDDRLGDEIAHVALDLADERRSAGRVLQPELWLCLGTHGGERAFKSMLVETKAPEIESRRAAALALGRAGHQGPLGDLRKTETDTEVLATIELALAGETDQTQFRALQAYAH